MSSAGELLTGIRVLDLSSNLAGLYAGRLLSDAGARVQRARSVTADLGDPGTGGSLRALTALEQVLNRGKRPIGDSEVGDILRDVDLVLDSGNFPGFDAATARERRPELCVVSLTEYGLTGPCAGATSCSNIRQAESGSTASRGTPARAPLMVGGETEQFLAGAYAAAAGVAALRGRHRTGRGDLIDLSLLEVSNLGQTLFGATLASMWDRAGEDFPRRSVQIPANERTNDGWVGLCTISARQRQDLLLIVGRPDLADSESLAYGRNDEVFDAQVHEAIATWAAERSTQEVIELASALRIPVSPLGNGATLTDNEQLRARDFFGRDADGLLRPGRTFRYTAAPIADPSSSQVAAGPGEAEPGPLSGLRVVDLTAWWAGPSASHLFAASGADVIKVESASHPDGMRYSFVADPSADGWWERGPVFYALNTNKRGVTLDFTTDGGRELLTELIVRADVLIENFTPRVLDSLTLDWEAIHARNPGLITVRMPAFGLDGPWRDRTGFAQTIEQSSGLAWITGHPDGPPVAPRGICDPLAGIHAAFACLAALHHRHNTGVGGVVEVSMFEPAAYAAIGQILAWQLDRTVPQRNGNHDHHHSPHAIYPTSEDDEWLALTVHTAEQWDALAELLRQADWRSPIWQDVRHRLHHTAEIDHAISLWLKDQTAGEAVALMRAAGIPASRVDGPGRAPNHPQLRHRRFFECVDHPVAGAHPIPGLPYRSAANPGPWNRTPAPTLGQHTSEVLKDWLGMAPERIRQLDPRHVGGTEPRNIAQARSAE